MQLSFQRRILIGIYFIKSLSNDWISSLVRINTDRVIGKQINDLTLCFMDYSDTFFLMKWIFLIEN